MENITIAMWLVAFGYTAALLAIGDWARRSVCASDRW